MVLFDLSNPEVKTVFKQLDLELKNRNKIMKYIRDSEDLCELVEKIGYRQRPYQLQCNNGSFVSSLLHFFDDNTGALEVVQNWIEENYELDEDEDEDEDQRLNDE